MMQFQLNNTLQFIHPDFDNPGSGNGIQTEANGKIAMVSNRESIRQAILLLLSTVPGERVMRPKYGCNLQQLAFMPGDETTLGLAIHYVRTALEKWEPRIDIIHLDAIVNEECLNTIEINLQYRIRHLHQNEQLSLAYHLLGADI